jgi:hypothetical protein
MKQIKSTSMVREIMMEFADVTGLSSKKKPRRYLWTDAFAVCNFLELYRQTHDEKYRHLAVRLVDQVYTILGRHREDDERSGWISGLSEEEGKKHPMIGGLRIGKEMNERKPGEPFDEDLEWDRDGQYYHYLTKWMHALNRVSRVTGDSTYNRWAIELAKTAHAKFTYVPSWGGQKRMYWKMSIDLFRPLVPSMGQHDPLDGFITYSQLLATAVKDSGKTAQTDLTDEIADMARMCEGINWTTDDPLGIGGLLVDAYRVVQLILNDDFAHPGLLEILLDSPLPGLELYVRKNPPELPADYRLAFRELGLAIGLHAFERLKESIQRKPDPFTKRVHSGIEALMRYAPLSEKILTFWLEPAHREVDSWTAHGDINMVMLATGLAPDGYLTM